MNTLKDDKETMMDTMLKAPIEVGKIIDIVPYETLSEETRSLVDYDAMLLSQMSDSEIMKYGWDIQSSKNDILNNVISGFETLSVETIEDILDDIMNSRKSVTPRNRTLLRREYMPTSKDKKNFVGKVGILEDAIKMQIQRILESNDNYVNLIHECKSIVDRYAISIMAIEKYLKETADTFLKDILYKKKTSLGNSRIANVQSAIMYMNLYKHNGLLVNRLYEIINVNLHQLQEQFIIQTGIDDIKKVLGQCEAIRDSISNLTASNIKELSSTTGMILSQNGEVSKSEETDRLMQEMVEGLRVLAKRESKKEEKEIIICSTQEIGISNPNESGNVLFKSVEKDLDYITFKNDMARHGFVLIEAESLSLNDEFMQHIPRDKEEEVTKALIIEAINRGVKNFWKPKGDVAFTNDGKGICYSPGEMPAVGKSYAWYEKAAKEFWPAFNSRLGSKLEYGAFLGVLIKKLIQEGKTIGGAWHMVCSGSAELGHYWNSENTKHNIEPTGSRENCGFCDIANVCKLLACDDEDGAFWVAGGWYKNLSFNSPIARFQLFYSYCFFDFTYAVGWIVLSYVA